VKGCFESVEEASTKNGVVRVIHIHHIESYILDASVAKATERYQ
jgi:hypothetical protein